MNTPKKILVLRFSSIGDIVLSSPLVRVLRAKFPQSQIDYVTRKEYAELVRSNQNINYTYEFDARDGFNGLRALKKRVEAEGYDLLVDIHGSLRSRYVRAFMGPARVVTVDKREKERAALVKFKKDLYKNDVPVSQRYIEAVEPLGVKDDGKGLELHIPDEILFAVSGKMAGLNLNQYEKVVGLCPTARHATKCWPKERFIDLGTRCARDRDAKVLLFGGNAEADYCDSIAKAIEGRAGSGRTVNFSGQLSLLETAAAMDFCDVVVTNDSGLMHIAEARQRNLVAVFGSTVRQFGFFPQSKNSAVIEREGLYCKPCSHIGRSSCPEKHFRCMNDISVDEVFEQTDRMLNIKS
jgi:lipopolysaccharide heptosyltransferase II